MVARYAITRLFRFHMPVQSRAGARTFCIFILASCLLPSLALAAQAVVARDGVDVGAHHEVRYVGDTLRVGVRAEPGSSAVPLEVVVTGAALEVLARQGRYVQVRTPTGRIGWVKEAYLSANAPAASILPALRQQDKTRRVEITRLRALLTRTQDERQRLEHALVQSRSQWQLTQRTLQEQIAGLQQQLAQNRTRTPAWLIWLLVILAAAVGCFAVGALWHRGHVTRRLGGLRL